MRSPLRQVGVGATVMPAPLKPTWPPWLGCRVHAHWSPSPITRTTRRRGPALGRREALTRWPDARFNHSKSSEMMAADWGFVWSESDRWSTDSGKYSPAHNSCTYRSKGRGPPKQPKIAHWPVFGPGLRKQLFPTTAQRSSAQHTTLCSTTIPHQTAHHTTPHHTDAPNSCSLASLRAGGRRDHLPGAISFRALKPPPPCRPKAAHHCRLFQSVKTDRFDVLRALTGALAVEATTHDSNPPLVRSAWS
jgi:hypothetical protein